MKTCNICNESKALSEFRFIPQHNHLQLLCKSCENKKTMLHKRTIPGLISRTYSHQKRSSIRRGHNPPTYSKEQLKVWFLSQPNLKELFDNWVASDYDRQLTPSVDRLDDLKGYSLDNIQLVTANQNSSGTKILKCKQVFQYDKELNLINTFISATHASNHLNISLNRISRYARGFTNPTNYIFSYSNSHSKSDHSLYCYQRLLHC